MGLHPGWAALQAAEKDLGFLTLPKASPLEPRPRAKDVGLKTAHDHVVRAEHRDSCRDKHEARHNWHQAADRAQDQKGDAGHSSKDMPQVSW